MVPPTPPPLSESWCSGSPGRVMSLFSGLPQEGERGEGEEGRGSERLGQEPPGRAIQLWIRMKARRGVGQCWVPPTVCAARHLSLGALSSSALTTDPPLACTPCSHRFPLAFSLPPYSDRAPPVSVGSGCVAVCLGLSVGLTGNTG